MATDGLEPTIHTYTYGLYVCPFLRVMLVFLSCGTIKIFHLSDAVRYAWMLL
jgi:hypothetical protein